MKTHKITVDPEISRTMAAVAVLVDLILRVLTLIGVRK